MIREKKQGYSEFPVVPDGWKLAGAEVTGGAGTRLGSVREEDGIRPSLRRNFRNRSAWPSP